MESVLEDDVMQDAQRALVRARRAIFEAQLALDRAEMRFQAIGIDPEVLVSQFEKQAGPAARREYELMVAAALADITDDSLLNRSQNRPSESMSASPRRMRFHV